MPSPPRGYTTFPSDEDLFYFCTTSSTSAEDLGISYAPPSQSSLRVGVIILGQDQIQLSDLAAVDLLSTLGRNRISRLQTPASTLDEAVDEVDIRYVSVTGEGSFPVTSGARMPVTNSFANAPQFDVLILPGSFSTRELSDAATSFLALQCSSPDLHAIFSVSSGILHLAQTGLLWERRASAPRCLIPALQQRYPDTLWQTKAWNRHEKIWTSSNAVSALDMIAAWMREFFWDRHEAVECALAAAGIGSLDNFDY
ncbi:class I glutamine amidotransferase-like protein [Boeremia exigua]|uniref:class I glutamine amidotransferase-like protein n=1 Tax=Boeremia exigua TaxID=749465 RepID=UPI001E8D10B3|nr:class I glutamine amidotransferase-like protein [Boeremia exigua]KAH6639783.1 class I glutamine amidotransferase-like protein [Boeremia exigua]